jgi:hypothetical protein
MKILYQYASRSRPQRFWEGIWNILKMQVDSENSVIHAVLDQDDPTIDEDFIAQIHGFELRAKRDILWNFGYSTGKINAINRPLPDIEWDILVNFSDDQRFILPGFDEVIREAFKIHGMDSFIHFPDQDAKAALSTMSIVGRPYYERDGFIYHSAFKSVWCDNFAMDIAARIFDHLNPAYGHLPRDAMFDHQQAFWNEDEATYKRLKAKIEDYV